MIKPVPYVLIYIMYNLSIYKQAVELLSHFYINKKHLEGKKIQKDNIINHQSGNKNKLNLQSIN